MVRTMTWLSLFTFMHWRRKWQPTPVFLPGESQARGSLVGCRLWGHTESDTTEWLSNSNDMNGEGNGNPLQYSCLENPMDRGAWQAIVHGVARVGHNLATKSPPIWYWSPYPPWPIKPNIISPGTSWTKDGTSANEGIYCGLVPE